MKIKRIISILLFFGLINLSGLTKLTETFAYYNDLENSPENILKAGSLDFLLNEDEWSPVEMAGALLPGDIIIRHLTVLANDSIFFQYKIKTVKTNGDDNFCNALKLTAKRENIILYNGALMDFNLTPPLKIEEDRQDDWTFEVSLPNNSSPFNGENCEFSFNVDGWQIGFNDESNGFSDHENLENLLESSVVENEDNVNNISPISDSYVEQDSPTRNRGNDSDLKIRSFSGEKNKRAFIKFDFHLPTNTLIQSADLKIFMEKAPSGSRSYGLARSLSSWTENDIVWDNQPSTSSPLISSVITGTTSNTWLSWNVKDDVAGFTAQTFSNHGWGLFDTAENSIINREGRFISRDEGGVNEDKRPVLEVAFSAPKATTTHLVINEVYYDVGHGKGSEVTNEWVEFYNPTESDIDIKNWQICDGTFCDTFATTSPSIIIQRHGFAVVTPRDTTWTKWTLPAGAIQIVIGSNIGAGLANSGDLVILKDSSNIEIDSMSYGNNTSKLNPSAPLSGEGNSLARIVKGYDMDSADDWIKNATPNPGTNPSNSGVEIIRFTDKGLEIADYADGLNPLNGFEANYTDDLNTDIVLQQENNVLINENNQNEEPVINKESEKAIAPPVYKDATSTVIKEKEEVIIVDEEISTTTEEKFKTDETLIKIEEKVLLEENLPVKEQDSISETIIPQAVLPKENLSTAEESFSEIINKKENLSEENNNNPKPVEDIVEKSVDELPQNDYINIEKTVEEKPTEESAKEINI